jgi:hypothetical protein
VEKDEASSATASGWKIGAKRPPRGGNGRSAWGWLSPTVQTLAAVGALAYATIRVSLQNFYDAFGLTPESVGINSTTILAQSSLRVIEFGALFALVPVLLVLALFVALDNWVPWPWYETESKTRRMIRRMLLAVPALAPYPLYQELTHGRTYSLVVPLSLLGLWALAAITREQERLTAKEIRHGRPGVVVVLWIGAAISYVLLTSLAMDGRDAGSCARNGVPVRYIHTHRHLPWLDPIPVLRVTAESVDPRDTAALDDKGENILYLGQSGGTAVFWDADRQRTLLVGSGKKIGLRPEKPSAHTEPAELTAEQKKQCKAVLSY